jgi:hypothetical protein
MHALAVYAVAPSHSSGETNVATHRSAVAIAGPVDRKKRGKSGQSY